MLDGIEFEDMQDRAILPVRDVGVDAGAIHPRKFDLKDQRPGLGVVGHHQIEHPVKRHVDFLDVCEDTKASRNDWEFQCGKTTLMIGQKDTQMLHTAGRQYPNGSERLSKIFRVAG